MGRLQQAANDQPALPNPLTSAHQRSLQRAIARRAQALPEGVRRTAYSRMHRHLKDVFEVASYKDIDESRFTEALGAVESISLEGELLPKSEALAVPEEGGLVLGAEDLPPMLTMCESSKRAWRIWQSQIGPAGQRHYRIGSFRRHRCLWLPHQPHNRWLSLPLILPSRPRATSLASSTKASYNSRSHGLRRNDNPAP